MPITSIVEIKNIIKLLKEKFDFDLSHLVINSLRYKLDNIIADNHLRNFDHLYDTVNGDPEFLDRFLSGIFHSSTALFRDPEMWINLKEKIIPGLTEIYDNINVLASMCSSGSDLFSLIILREEMNWKDIMNIEFSYISEFDRKLISGGKIKKSLTDLSINNMERIFANIERAKYIGINKNKTYIHGKFLQNIRSFEHDFNHDFSERKYHLIFCRNKFLLFNLNYQNLMLDKFVRIMENRGVLVTGFRENISDYMGKNNKLVIMNSYENIFRKKYNLTDG